MTSTSIKYNHTSDRVARDEIRNAMDLCRLGTLKIFDGMDDATFRCQAHPDFSPVGWHLGHIAFTEGLWLLERCAGMPPLFPDYRKLMAQDGLPKHKRIELPPLPEILDYLQIVREQVFEYLETAPIAEQERLWRFILQHESQHTETIALILQMLGKQSSALNGVGTEGEQSAAEFSFLDSDLCEAIAIPAGEFWQGSNASDALDNERSLHRRYVPTYYIDRYPVTCAQYRQFIQANGYHNPRFWSSAGWEWLQTANVTQPLYWIDDRAFDLHPVCGVSYYEAEAYARFVGKRLPTEAEWEKAASWNPQSQTKYIYPWGDDFPNRDRCNYDNLLCQTTPVNAYPKGVSSYGCYDMVGNVWEWTSTCFEGYEGFEFYPYAGYSQAYFDGQHQVLKGGSWTTRPWAMRCSFRNWYHPWIRQIFAGFRCARDPD